MAASMLTGVGMFDCSAESASSRQHNSVATVDDAASWMMWFYRRPFMACCC